MWGGRATQVIIRSRVRDGLSCSDVRTAALPSKVSGSPDAGF